MLVSFVGLPASGKTTIATKMFSSFKENGTNCELITEIARQYIANIRYEKKLTHYDKILLTDEDQKNIAIKQFELERIMKYSCDPSTIIISDSSVLNAGMYMSTDLYNNESIKEFLKNASLAYDLLFFCHPIDLSALPEDSNRVHDLEFIQSIKSRALNLLDFIKSYHPNVCELIGTMTLEARFNDACSTTLNRHCDLVSRM